MGLLPTSHRHICSYLCILYVCIYVVVCGYKNIGEYVCMFRCGYMGITLCVGVGVGQGTEKAVNPLDSKYIYWAIEVVNKIGCPETQESHDRMLD